MKKIFIVVLISFTVVLFFLVGGLFLYKGVNKPLDANSKKQNIVEIFPGEGVRDIGFKLESEKIIKNDLYFIFYAINQKNRGRFQAGRYLVSPSMSITQIAQKMIKGDVVPNETKVTIPEGFTISKIEKKINKAYNKTDLKLDSYTLSLFNKKYPILSDAPHSASLEGYLFPDTYFFLKEDGMKNVDIENVVIEKMLDNFQNKISPKFKKDISIQNKTLFDIVIMASVIEKEVTANSDKKIVSGIFWKRIKNGMPLQADSTVAYVLGVDKLRYSLDDIQIDSPYNTYKNKGLPRGPISNPGIDSIKAAIYPQSSNYNYFVSDPKNGKTIFARTLDEHNQNINKYLK
jgi:UPF0755 protein